MLHGHAFHNLSTHKADSTNQSLGFAHVVKERLLSHVYYLCRKALDVSIVPTAHKPFFPSRFDHIFYMSHSIQIRSQSHAKRIGGWYAVSCVLVAVWILRLIGAETWTNSLPFHLHAVVLILPVIAYRLGSLAGIRILVEGDHAIFQGVACLVACMASGLLSLIAMDFLYALLTGNPAALGIQSPIAGMHFLIRGTLPVAPLGILLGAGLGLLRT